MSSAAETTSIEMTDQGCMLRAYRRPIIDAIVRSGANNTFIPALAYSFSGNPTEVGVQARGAPRRASRTTPCTSWSGSTST